MKYIFRSSLVFPALAVLLVMAICTRAQATTGSRRELFATAPLSPAPVITGWAQKSPTSARVQASPVKNSGTKCAQFVFKFYPTATPKSIMTVVSKTGVSAVTLTKLNTGVAYTVFAACKASPGGKVTSKWSKSTSLTLKAPVCTAPNPVLGSDGKCGPCPSGTIPIGNSCQPGCPPGYVGNPAQRCIECTSWGHIVNNQCIPN